MFTIIGSFFSNLNSLINKYIKRVTEDGGVVESSGCIDDTVNASIYLKPSGIKDGKIYSVLPEDGSADVPFIRGGDKTRVNKDGNIEVITNNTPPLDYKNGGCPVFNFEPQSTNLIDYSEDFSDSSWSKININLTSDTLISPDGTLNASLIKGNGVSGFSRLQKSISASGHCTYSVFVKKELSEEINLYILGTGLGGGSDNTSIYRYNFNTNSFTKRGGADADNLTAFDYGNGWVRLSMSILSTTITEVRLYSGWSNVSTDGVYVWGFQIEELSYASSYIATNGTIVTRLADQPQPFGNSSLINSEEGVLYAEMAALFDDGTNRAISLSDGTPNNSVRLYYNSSQLNQITMQIRVGNSVQAIKNFTLSNSLDFNQFAIKYKENDFALFVNGVEVGTDVSGVSFAPNTLNNLSFNRGGTSGDEFRGNILDLRVYKSISEARENLPYIPDSSNDYYNYRVLAEGGVVKSLTCIEE